MDLTRTHYILVVKEVVVMEAKEEVFTIVVLGFDNFLL
jgi:hypothetical protein